MKFCNWCKHYCSRCGVCNHEVKKIVSFDDPACINFKEGHGRRFPKGKCKDCVNSGLTKNKEYYCEAKEDVVSPKSTCGLFEPINPKGNQ